MVRVAAAALLLLAGPCLLLAQTSVDQAEVDEVLAELDEAGAPATEAEISEFLSQSSAGRWNGTLLGQSGWSRAGGLHHTARMRLTGEFLRMRLRWKQYADGETQQGGAVVYGPERWQVGAGRLAMASGFGLLVGAPGRGPALTADGSLAARSRNLVLWSGAPVAQEILGLSAGLKLGAWQVQGLAGRRGDDAAAQTTAMVQIIGEGPSWRLGGLLLSDPDEQGVSLSGRIKRGTLASTWEGLWRRPLGSATPLRTLLAQAGWQPHHKVRMELLGGWADPGPRPVMGQKHPIFGDWGGRGAAVRGTWRADGGLGLKVLAHRGRGRESIAAGRRQLRSLTDVQMTQKWKSGWSTLVRWRQSGETIGTWSERFPWQPPAVDWRDSRRVLSVQAKWQGSQTRGQVLWRQLNQQRVRQKQGVESGGVRSLVTLSTAHQWGAPLRLRASWTVSWGDPVDLVSAVVPFGGYVLPRHWGHWQNERLVGLEWWRGPWQFKAAMSWRRPQYESFGPGEPDAIFGWMQAVWNW